MTARIRTAAGFALRTAILAAFISAPLSAEPEWRKEMPWYDEQKGDYKQYGPEDIRPYLEKKEARPARSGFHIPDLTFLVYAAAAAAAGAALYLIARRFLDRMPQEEEIAEETPIRHVAVVDLPEAALPDQDLDRAIERLLAEGNFRRAGMLLFQLACNRLRSAGLLDFHASQTPREIAASPLQDPPGQVLSLAARIFEDCAYRPEAPSGASVMDLRDRIRSLNA